MIEYINSYITVAQGKINNKKINTFILAILAGVFIALASATSTIVISNITNGSIARILSGLVFPIGLILVILLKTELFTGNSLLIIPVLSKDIKVKELLKNWLIVYLGNFVGSIIIAILIRYSGILNTFGTKAVSIAVSKVSYSFTNALILGILCNILVCIAVFLALNMKTITEKIAVIIFPIMMFIIMGLEHSVANMYYLSVGFLFKANVDISTKTLNISNIFLKNLLPVTLGNIIGGCLFGFIIWFVYKRNTKN